MEPTNQAIVERLDSLQRTLEEHKKILDDHIRRECLLYATAGAVTTQATLLIDHGHHEHDGAHHHRHLCDERRMSMIRRFIRWLTDESNDWANNRRELAR